MVIELFAVQRPNHEQVIGAGAEVRQKIREFHAAVAMLLKRARRAHEHGAVGLDESEPRFIENRFGQLLAVEFV